MTLYQRLQQCKSEEDVKDAYIKALGLKGYSKNLIDIQTKEIWFEAKDSGKNSTYAMFTQLMHYVQQTFDKNVYIFLPVSFKAFENAYKALTEKLQPMVYELGFLKN
jgi:hypothetical protein